MARYLLHCVLVVAVVVDSVLCARVLAVLPIPAHSHHVLSRAVLGALARRGHEVLSFTSLPMDQPPPNYREIHLDTVRSVEKMSEFLTARSFLKRKRTLANK